MTELKLDPFTLGKSPAALYLTDMLNELGDAKLSRKIGCHITELRSTIRQLITAQAAGLLSIKTVTKLLNQMREVQSYRIEHFVYSNLQPPCDISSKEVKPFVDKYELVNNLACNIAIAELKSALRRASTARVLEQQQFRDFGRNRDAVNHVEKILKTKVAITPPKISHMNDPINEALLQKRSREKLQRKGKISRLY